MTDPSEVRLELIKLMIPKASQVGITNPDTIIESCSQFEKYVLGSDVSEDSPTSNTKKHGRRPRKGQVDEQPSVEMTPAHVG